MPPTSLKHPSTPRWHELSGLHAGGQMALIVGKGPSLDAWLAEGCPRPDCASVVIGVNHAGARFPFTADYHISGHKFAEFGQIPGAWAVGVNSQDSRADEHWDVPDYAAWWFLVTYGWRALSYTREQIAFTHRLFHRTSSAQLALHFAWYLGFDSVQLIGIDGGRAHAQAMAGVPGVSAPTADYDLLKQHTHELADHLFPGRWWHWQPRGARNEEARMTKDEGRPSGELWKYQGIYAAQTDPASPYCGYGHSNHGLRALPWLLEQGFTSLLDVGCGHNEFVKAWRQHHGQAENWSIGVLENGLLKDWNATPSLHPSIGCDFACPNADVIAPATALPFADGLFDVVTSFDLLEHLPEPEVLPALREMRRVSRTAFCFSIATAPSRVLWCGQNLHPTVKPLEWWLERIREAGGEPQVMDGYVRGRWQASGMTKPE